MKILKIRFENINSLKGLHEIDFQKDPLASSGLFAITGATGSGKSSILDVITLALFDRIPRIKDKISRGLIERTGLLLTRNMQECMAEVTYECKKGVYTSKWSISKARTGSLRDYAMEISDQGGNLLDLKKTDVPAKNEELIGLNFDQFIKAIMLAQGDFAAFLKAKGDERGRLLEQVTGSWIYRELGKAAFYKNKELGEELENLQRRESIIKENMLDKEAYDALLAELKNCEKGISGLSSKSLKLNEQINLKKDIISLATEIDKSEKEKAGLQLKLKIFNDDHGELLEKHRKLIPFRDDLSDWKNLNTKIKDYEAGLKENEGNIIKSDLESKQITREVSELCGSTEDVPQQLTALENQVLDLDNKIKETKTRARGNADLIMQNARELDADIDISDPERAISIAQDNLETANTEMKTREGELDTELLTDPPSSIKVLRTYHDHALKYQNENVKLLHKQEKLDEECKAIEDIEKSVLALPDQIKTLKDKKEKSELVLNNLKKDFRIRELSASLEEHRTQLKDGEACPLCGALEHPYVKSKPELTDELSEEIAEAEKAFDQCKQILIEKETLLKEKNGQIKSRKESLEGLKADIKSLNDSCRHILAELPAKYHSVQPGEILSQMNRLEDYISSQKKQKILTAVISSLKELNNLKKHAASLKKNRDAIFQGEDIRAVTSNLMRRFTENITESKKLKEDKDKLSRSLKESKTTFKNLEKSLIKSLPDYAEIKDAFEDIIPETEYLKLNREEQEINNGLIKVKERSAVHKKSLAEKKEKDVDKELVDIQEELNELKDQLEQENLKRDEFKSRQTMQEKSMEELESLKESMEVQKKKSEKWVLLNKYIGDAEGKKFSTFAQQLTLVQLVKLANERMKMLNDRYQLDIPEENKDDSLDVIDTHMGDLRRSVKSLSGGESFLVSLSLALALSDLASKQVVIRSLFIDEGFGSLDKLTLDQTIDTLEKLQYETNKTIGVISHIESMQERISTQIRLTKNGQGYSSMEIV